MNILMVASEATPFAKTGGLADVLGSLPAALQHARRTSGRGDPRLSRQSLPARHAGSLPLSGDPYRPRLYRGPISETTERGVTYYFVRLPGAIRPRRNLWRRVPASRTTTCASPCSRMAALGVARHLFRPDILHLHDWQAALFPSTCASISVATQRFSGVKTLFTIHNLGYQGHIRPRSAAADRPGCPRCLNPEQLEFFGDVNFMKGGIAWSDAISTVSQGYAQRDPDARVRFRAGRISRDARAQSRAF